MRRIDQNKIKADADWDALAATEEAKRQAGTLVKDCKPVWGQVKARLKDVSNGKCWYCEARQERADNDVDHFRPKSIYPWLAFTLDNFRYACTFCNRVRKNPDTGGASGKGDHFPLFGGARATTVEQLANEDLVLLDPCRGADPGLLDFTDDGRPCAKYPDQPKRADRANQSIHYYHLDHPDLIESRRQLALQLMEWIDGADALYEEIDQGDPKIERAFSRFAESICRALSENAEFSVFARRILDGYRNRPWVDDILQYA